MAGLKIGGKRLLVILAGVVVIACICWYVSYQHSQRWDVKQQHWISQRSEQATQHPETMDPVERLLLAPNENESQNIITTINELAASQDEEDREEAWKHAGALAACGGPDAAEFLAAFYDAHTVKEHVEPPPPYPLPDGSVYNPHNDDARFIDWDRASLTHAGETFCAYLWRGPGNPHEISLAVDHNSDGLFEAVYYTGLRDTAEYAMMNEAQDAAPQERLELRWGAGKFVIKHHSSEKYMSAQSVKLREYPGCFIVESRTSLDALKLDSDGDGLADVFESLLHTNPASIDTDGDGLPDAQDPHPLADPAKMDRLARGVARAFTYLQESERYFWDTDTPDNQPQEYCFIDTGNVPGVAWTPVDYAYGVAGDRFDSWAGYIHTFWLVSKDEVAAGWPEASSASANPDEFFALFDAQRAFGYVNRDRVEYVLHCFETLQQSIVILVDVEGELYPATAQVIGTSQIM